MIGRLIAWWKERRARDYRDCTCTQWERTYPCLKRYGKFDCRAIFREWSSEQW